MDKFIPLNRLVAELGLDRAQTRDRLRQCGVRPHKVRAGGTDGPIVLYLTPEEAACVRAGGAGAVSAAGALVVIQLVPELDPSRIRIEFTGDVPTHLNCLRHGAPTASVRKAWPCRPEWAAAAVACLRVRCRFFLDDALECFDLDGLVGRGDQFFALMPPADHIHPGGPMTRLTETNGHAH